jgi:Ni,Fe-hydrogenase III small subunit
VTALWKAVWRNLFARHPGATRATRRDMAVVHRECGSCNGCEIELRLALSPAHDSARRGLSLTPSPQQADILLVTGPVTHNTQARLGATWDAMPDPKFVVALGDCAIDGGVFRGSYAVAGGAGSTLPVDFAIRGCPPTARQILDALGGDATPPA